MTYREEIHSEIITEVGSYSLQIKSLTMVMSSLVGTSNNSMELWDSIISGYLRTVSTVIATIEITLKRFIDEDLVKWRKQQQHAAIGMELEESVSILTLDEIQIQCSQIFDQILSILEQLKNAGGVLPNSTEGNVTKTLEQLVQSVMHILRLFIQETFLFVVQPPLVMSRGCKGLQGLRDPTGAICSASLTVGPAILQFVDQSSIKISLINEEEAKRIYSKGETAVWELTMDDRRFETGEIKVTASKNRLMVYCEQDTLDKLLDKRRLNGLMGKGKNKANPEEKSCLLFSLIVDIGGVSTQIWTTSLPAHISSYVSQRGVGFAIIVRDYLTSEVNRIPFEIPHPEYITWDELSLLVQCLFRKYFDDDDLLLTKENLNCIRDKAISAVKSYKKEFENEKICLEKIPWDGLKSKTLETLLPHNTTHSFWDWIFGTFSFLKDHANRGEMLEMWKRGLIIGWIGKQTAEERLKNEPPGTFLLRFPDRFISAISIVSICEDRQIHHLRPYLYDDLRSKSLANQLKEFIKLEYIYPFHHSSPKKKLMEEFYSCVKINFNF